MSVTLNKSTLVKDVTPEDLQAALALLAESQAKQNVVSRKADLAAAIAPIVEEILDMQPAKPSSKAESAWVGSVVGGLKVEIDGQPYTVQVTVKDDGASQVRKALIG